jgi:hypothetical protein
MKSTEVQIILKYIDKSNEDVKEIQQESCRW